MARTRGPSKPRENDAIGNIVMRRRRELSDTELTAYFDQTERALQVWRDRTLRDLGIAVLYNEVSHDEMVALCSGVFRQMLLRLSQARGDDPVGKAAMRLIDGSMAVLLRPDKYDGHDKIVLELDAMAQGFSGVDSHAVLIVELAKMVESQAGLRTLRDPADEFVRVRIDGQETTVGDATPGNFHQWLARRHGTRGLPSVDESAGWLDKHTTRRAPGKLTTVGIVAKIAVRMELLGAGSETTIRDRVRQAIKRSEK
jgi:hypothetical protein